MKLAYFRFWFVLYDFLTASVVWFVFYVLRKHILNEMPETMLLNPVLSSLVVGLFWVVLYALGGGYDDIFRKSRVKEIFLTFMMTLIGALIIFFVLLLNDKGVQSYQDYYKTFTLYFSLHFISVAIEKSLVLTYTKYLVKKGKIFFNTLVLGSNERAKELYDDLLKINDSLGLRFLGFLSVFESADIKLLNNDLRYFGDIKVLKTLCRRVHVDHVIVAVNPSEHDKIAEILNIMIDFPHVKISVIPDLYQIMLGSGKVNHILGVPLIEIKQALMPLWQSVAKRMIDIVVSLLVLIIGFPVFLTFGLITVFTSKGPMFYAQIRVGKNKVPFYIFKYRSMIPNAELNGPLLSSDGDPRITKWGKFMRKTRIDELPQFYNVLIGDMSLVGPRPERKFFIDKILEEAPYYNHVFKVRPGITSLGQVKYGYAENVEQMVRRLKYDMLYIESMSLSMDFRILLTTILIVIQGRGK